MNVEQTSLGWERYAGTCISSPLFFYVILFHADTNVKIQWPLKETPTEVSRSLKACPVYQRQKERKRKRKRGGSNALFDYHLIAPHLFLSSFRAVRTRNSKRSTASKTTQFSSEPIEMSSFSPAFPFYLFLSSPAFVFIAEDSRVLRSSLL